MLLTTCLARVLRHVNLLFQKTTADDDDDDDCGVLFSVGENYPDNIVIFYMIWCIMPSPYLPCNALFSCNIRELVKVIW